MKHINESFFSGNAVLGHTQMALAMTKDKLYTKDMLNHISSDTNLQNDIKMLMGNIYQVILLNIIITSNIRNKR